MNLEIFSCGLQKTRSKPPFMYQNMCDSFIFLDIFKKLFEISKNILYKFYGKKISNYVNKIKKRIISKHYF